ncbi:MAG: hypothetical protein MI757_01085 [Pirellulales bacterium]|nr:hypothetical protein [Pirellulales bacterium]
MEKIAVECANCNATLKAPPEFAGKVATCPECGTKVRVPVGPTSPQGAPPAAAPAGGPPKRRAPAAAAPADPLGIDTGGEDPFAAAPAGAPVRARGRKKSSIDSKTAGIVAAVVLVVGGAGYWFATRSAGPGDAMRYMPDDLAVMAVVRYDDIVNSKFTKTAQKELPQAKNADKMAQGMVGRELGWSEDEFDKLDQIWVGGNAKDDAVIYAMFKEDVSSKKIRGWFDNKKFESSSVGDKKLYKSGSMAFCVVDSRAAIFGKSDMLKDVLKRDSEPKMARGMNDALGSADMSNSMCLAMTLRAKGLKKDNMAIPGVEGVDKVMKSADSIVLQVDFGSDMEFDLAVVCDDSDDAKKLKKAADEGLEKVEAMAMIVLGKAGKEIFERIDVKSSGATMRITGDIDVDLLEKVAESAKKAGPPKFPFGS